MCLPTPPSWPEVDTLLLFFAQHYAAGASLTPIYLHRGCVTLVMVLRLKFSCVFVVVLFQRLRALPCVMLSLYYRCLHESPAGCSGSPKMATVFIQWNCWLHSFICSFIHPTDIHCVCLYEYMLSSAHSRP